MTSNINFYKKEPDILVVCGIVVKNSKNGKYLLVQEAKPQCYGKWNFPAGWLDPGENIVEAAKREVKEETGIEINKLDGFIGIFQDIKKVKKKTVIKFAFAAHTDKQTMKFPDDKLLDVQWFSFREVKNKDLRTKDILLIIEKFEKAKIYPLDLFNFKII